MKNVLLFGSILVLLLLPFSNAIPEEEQTLQLPIKGSSVAKTEKTNDGTGDIIVTKKVYKKDITVRGHGYRSIPKGVMQYHNCGNVISYEGKVYMFDSSMDGFYDFGRIHLTLNREMCIIKLEVY